MAKRSTDVLKNILQKNGFMKMNDFISFHGVSCFAGPFQSEEKLTTVLCFDYKPLTRVIGVHIGWRHSPTDIFCLKAIESEWVGGRIFLEMTKADRNPCISSYDIARYMGLEKFGIPVDDPQMVETNVSYFIEMINKKEGWLRPTLDSLLSLYAGNDPPFKWLTSNSAVRLGQVAGLVAFLGKEDIFFERCVSEHYKLIQRDISGIGDAEEWIFFLRSYLEYEKKR